MTPTESRKPPPTPAFTLAQLDENPTVALLAQAQRNPPKEMTRAEHIAGCLAYAERQPPWIAAEIERLHRQHGQWEEAIDVLRRLHKQETR